MDSNILKEVLDIFSKTAIQVCEGQQWDMDFEMQKNVNLVDYMKMIEYKTAVLMAASLQIGAITAGASNKDQAHIYEFGLNMGIAFQIQDDLRDLYGDPKLVGKQVGGDIIANKNTLLMVIAKESANENQLKTLEKLSTQTDIETKIEGIIALFKTLKVQEKCHGFLQSNVGRCNRRRYYCRKKRVQTERH